MNSAAPPLMPIFRSDAQARILAWLLLDPTREQPIATLTEVAGLTQSNVLREVNRLVEAGVLRERRAGNARLVQADTSSPYFEPLVAILSRTYGPASAVPAELRSVPGIEQVILIGSWAQRFTGEPGPPPRDVDVVVVGDPDRRALRAANRRLEEQLHQTVQLTAVPRRDWEAGHTGFVATAKRKPHVVVLDNREQSAAEVAAAATGTGDAVAESRPQSRTVTSTRKRTASTTSTNTSMKNASTRSSRASTTRSEREGPQT